MTEPKENKAIVEDIKIVIVNLTKVLTEENAVIRSIQADSTKLQQLLNEKLALANKYYDLSKLLKYSLPNDNSDFNLLEKDLKALNDLLHKNRALLRSRQRTTEARVSAVITANFNQKKTTTNYQLVARKNVSQPSKSQPSISNIQT